jgi:hypothetical protein
LATFPKPTPGLVIRYSYLWADEHELGRDEGLKDRPCAVIVVVESSDDTTSVIVLPITHSLPTSDTPAMEIPIETKRRLRLDDDRSWIILSEANQFDWPGFDLRFLRSEGASTIAYGELPANFFRDLRSTFVKVYKSQRIRLVPRS